MKESAKPVPKQKKRRKIGLLEMGAVKMNVHAAEFPQVDMKESVSEEDSEDDDDDDDKDDGLPNHSKKQKRNRTQPPRFSI